MNESIAAIVLSAGESTRMGRPKALLPWGEGCVLGHILDQIERAGLQNRLVITGAHDTEIRRSIPSATPFLYRNPEWKTGMGSSLRCGVSEAMRRFKHLDGFLVLLCDQPLIASDYLIEMLTAFSRDPNRAVASEYEEGAGVPALFPKSLVSELQHLDGNVGARKLLRNRKDTIGLLLPGESGMDMDTPEQYRQLKRRWLARQNEMKT